MRFLPLIFAILSLAPCPAAADVQPPELAAPQRGSLAGEFANVAFGPADVSRGGFSLPSAFQLPTERGAPLVSVFPTYSPDAGLSEWGLGWQNSLAITRWRATGDLDYHTDELSSPWGYLKAGNDGYWYPLGLQTPVRVELAGDTVRAYLPDGAIWTFGGNARIQRPAGTFAWYLTDVLSPTLRRTHLDWAANASGRPYLTGLTYGGVGNDAQYHVGIDYEPVPLLFVSYASGGELYLDQRVKTVRVEAKHAQTGAFAERWRYDLVYQSDAYGPAFFLTEVDQTFAAGDRAPPIKYGFRSARDHLDATDFVAAPSIDPLLAQWGEDVIQPNRTAQLDADNDGRTDLEDHTRGTLLHQIDGGFESRELPPAASNAFSLCRPPDSPYNATRHLAQMRPESDDWQVVAMLADTWLSHTEIDICSREGALLSSKKLDGYWLLDSAENKLVDVNRDHLPDLVSVGYGQYLVVPNRSTASGFDFDAPVYGFLQPVFAPEAYWLHDFNGDGLVDLVARDGSSLTVWFGRGDFQFVEQGQTFDLRTVAGVTVSQLQDYQFSFLDVNRDGLTDVVLTRANGFALFVNNGYYLMETPIAAFHGLGPMVSPPVVADLTGSGDAQLVVTEGGHARALTLDEAGTNLLAWADDGKGTTLRFDYARGPAAPGARQRHAVLHKLEVVSSGYDPHAFTYTYQDPATHHVGRYFLGYQGVESSDGLTTQTDRFVQDEVVSGLVLESRTADTLTPGAVRTETKQYEPEVFAGVPWLRLKRETAGWASPDGARSVEERTDYLGYEAEICPAIVEHRDEHGTLRTEHRRALPAGLAKSLHCLEAETIESGSHGDKRLDFREDKWIQRDDAGVVKQSSQAGSLGTLTLQTVQYNPDYTIASISRPGRGTSTFRYDPKTHLLAGVTTPDGVSTSIPVRNPLTDDIQALTTDRGGMSYTQSFRFDGQERLVKGWDDLGHASETSPEQELAYRYATATQPGAVTVKSLVELQSGSVARAIELATAKGEALARTTAIPQGWTFEPLTTRNPGLGLSAVWRRPSTASDPLALDLTALQTGLQQVSEAHASSFGVLADAITHLHPDVQRRVSASWSVSNGHLIELQTENGVLPLERDLDADRQVVRLVDQAGSVFGYGYDARGRLRAVALPDGSGHRVKYDDYGRVVHVERDGIATLDFAFDAVTGLPTVEQWSTPAGAVERTVQWSYDAAGRKKTETHTDGTGASLSYSFYYDGATPSAPSAVSSTRGLLTGVAGDGYTKALSYRADGKLLARTLDLPGFRTVTSRFDYVEGGNLKRSTTTVAHNGALLATSTHENVFDAWGRIAGVKLDGAPLASFTYDGNGKPTTATFAGGETVTLGYDPLTRGIVSVAAAGIGWSSLDAFKLNERGFVGSELLSVGNQSAARRYGYTAQGFLASSIDPHDSYGYQYDGFGLPTEISKDGVGTAQVRSGAVLQAGGVEYEFDGLGRTVRKGDLALSYGPNGQLALATRGTASWSFKYDENGQRLLKLAGTAPVAAYLEEGYLDAQGLTEPLSFSGLLVGAIQHGVFKLLATDVRGTVLADSDGTSRLPSPFGERAVHPDLSAAIDFVQKAWDADLGLVRMGVRDYDPAINRFLTPDPLFLAQPAQCIGSPIECNLYVYARNNPLAYVDPTGHIAEWIHDVADAVSLIPGVGEFVDAGHAVVYACEGHWGKAAASAAMALPIVHEVGDVAKGVKLGVKIVEHGAEKLAVHAAEHAAEHAVEHAAEHAAEHAVEHGAEHVGEHQLEHAAEKSTEAGRKIPNSELKAPPAKRGNAPIGKDGHPVELHHRGQKSNSPLDEMTRTDHRGGANFKKNHGNTGKHPSEINRKQWKKQQKKYWKKEWDGGRFKK